MPDSHATASSPKSPRTEAVSNCPVCDSASSAFLFEAPDRYHHIPGVYAYRRCRACASVYQAPRVVEEDLPLCYPERYYTHDDTRDSTGPEGPYGDPGGTRFRDRLRRAIAAAARGEQLPGPIGLFGRVLSISRRMRERGYCFRLPDELLPRRPSPVGRAVDIGCGSGQLLRQLCIVGWECVGVEWDPRAAEAARRVSGCPIHTGDVREIDLPGGTYDLVVMSHVLEHIGDPTTALRAVRRLLTPTGAAVLFYPNPDGFPARLYGKDYFQWDPPRHLVLPSITGLRRLAARCGLQVRCVTSRVLCRQGVRTFYAISRAWARGHSRAAQSLPPITPGVRWLVRLEQTLTTLRFPYGTDVVAVLVRGGTE
jgi:SAM-dependent methyltransferase